MSFYHPNKPIPRVRNATPEDLSAMAAVMYQAMPQDPQWDYRFPLRKAFPQDTYGHTRRMLRSMLEEEGVHVMVATFSSPDLEEEDEVPVGLAVWELHEKPRPKDDDSPDDEDGSPDDDNSKKPKAEETVFRRDADFSRVRAYTSALASAKKSYFEDKYQLDPGYLHLRILATHPDFQRRGVGTALCRCGMELAKEKKLYVTVFASPMGQRLFTSLKFECHGVVPVRLTWEGEKLSIGAMICRPPHQPWRESVT